MGVIIVALALAAILVLAAYVGWRPRRAAPRLVVAFDRMVLGVCAVLCLSVFFGLREDLVGTADERWALPFALFGALLAEVVFLTVLLLVRNFWVFRPSRAGNGF